MSILNPFIEVKNLANHYSAISESNEAIKKFEEGLADQVHFSSKNQAKLKKKMALIGGMKSASDIVIPIMLIHMASGHMIEQYAWVQDQIANGNTDLSLLKDNVLNTEALELHAKDAKILWDYVSSTSITASAAILSATATAFSSVSQLKNPSEIRFHKKEKEQNKILKEFFKDSFISKMVEEDDMLMLGFAFGDALKKHKGVDNKILPLLMMKTGAFFTPYNGLDNYNKEKEELSTPASSVYEFSKKMMELKTDKETGESKYISEINDYMEHIIKHEKNDKNKFDKRDQAKYLGEKLEKAYEKVYRERELEKTALITVKMIARAKASPEDFKKIAEKSKRYFNRILEDELPLEDKIKYKEILNLLKETELNINRNTPEKLPSSEELKEVMIKFNLGNNDHILERVKTAFVEIVKEDSYQLRNKITNSNKENKKLKTQYNKRKIKYSKN